MILQMLIILLYGSFIIIMQKPTAAVAVQSSKCKDRCGNIAVAFPFGIGSRGCFLNEWFEIVCKRNDTVPWLRKLDLEVLDVEGALSNFPSEDLQLITVMTPIVYSNRSCLTNSTSAMSSRAPISLEGSPFFYSKSQNILVAVGCNHRTLLDYSEPNYVGCKSECRGQSSGSYKYCDGSRDCCSASISSSSSSSSSTLPGFQTFSVEFEIKNSSSQKTNGDRQCSYAFLIRESTVPVDPHSLIMAGLYAPTVLVWGIPNDSSNYTLHLIDSCNASKSCITRSSNNYIYSLCQSGYSGHPYLINGCQDVNECKDGFFNWCSPGNCVNTIGGYYCNNTMRTVGPANNSADTMIGVGSGLGVLLVIIWGLHILINKRKEIKRKEKFFKRNGGIMLQKQISSPEGSPAKCELFKAEELEKATDNFNKNRILGQGGQGTVYKGMLSDGRIVAVKKSTAIDGDQIEQFINEVVTVSQINHRNIVKLLGCCLETETPLLVYELIPNGTLYQHLHKSNEELPISWEVRLRLASEVAAGLSYLHSAASIPIFHRDIKSSNILLDEKYQAKIADFGTSRPISLDQTHVTTLVQGTFGYLDPEYFRSSQFTEKSDVYSFGVVLVELLTGEKAVCSLRAEEGKNLAMYFIMSMENDQLLDIIDPRVLKDAEKDETIAVGNLAKRCLELSGKRRPSMREVSDVLEGIMRKPLPAVHHDHIQDDSMECFSIDQYSETDGSSSPCDTIPTSTRSEMIVRVFPLSDDGASMYGRTW